MEAVQHPMPEIVHAVLALTPEAYARTGCGVVGGAVS